MKTATGGRSLLLLSLVLCAAAPAHASTLYVPNGMGRAIKTAELIVIADVHGEGLKPVLECKEVLKGWLFFWKRTIELDCSQTSREDPCGALFGDRNDLKGIAVLLRENWKTSKAPVLAVFKAPEEIRTLRRLLDVYNSKKQEARLNDLFNLCVSAPSNRFISEALVAEFGSATDPHALPFMLSLAAQSAVPIQTQVHLVYVLGRANDARVIPFLVEQLKDPDPWISQSSASLLASYYPGEQGVAEAFRNSLDNENVKNTAARYLLRREDCLECEVVLQQEEAVLAQKYKNARRRNEILQNGDAKAKLACYREMAADEDLKSMERIRAAEDALPIAGSEDLDAFRRLVLPLITEVLQDKGSWVPREIPRTLRGLHHPDCLDSLLAVVLKKGLVDDFDECSAVAAMAIGELGDAARNKGAECILGLLKEEISREPLPPSSQKMECAFHLLVCLRDEKAFQEATAILEPGASRDEQKVLQYVRQLVPVLQAQDEGKALCDLLASMLQEKASGMYFGIEWTTFLLCDRREARSVPLLLHRLEATDYPYGYDLQAILVQMFTQLDGSEIESAMLRLLRHPGTDDRRRIAFDTLCAIKKQQLLPELCRTLTEDDRFLKHDALHRIKQWGTPEQLPLLLPLCNFWTSDKEFQQDALDAVATIRSRYDYDVNGPIRCQAQDSE